MKRLAGGKGGTGFMADYLTREATGRSLPYSFYGGKEPFDGIEAPFERSQDGGSIEAPFENQSLDGGSSRRSRSRSRSKPKRARSRARRAELSEEGRLAALLDRLGALRSRVARTTRRARSRIRRTFKKRRRSRRRSRRRCCPT